METWAISGNRRVAKKEVSQEGYIEDVSDYFSKKR
jgi:hypothetical protein